MKHNLLLSYSTFLIFYLLLKVEGRNIKNHPVVYKLAHIKTLFQKLQPVDDKIKVEIEKILNSNAEAEDEEESEEEPAGASQSGDDENMSSQGDEESMDEYGQEGQDDEDEDDYGELEDLDMQDGEEELGDDLTPA